MSHLQIDGWLRAAQRLIRRLSDWVYPQLSRLESRAPINGLLPYKYRIVIQVIQVSNLSCDLLSLLPLPPLALLPPRKKKRLVKSSANSAFQLMKKMIFPYGVIRTLHRYFPESEL